ncbi:MULTISPECIES: GNAT family N-acetyltransferase [unclassified Pseudomonas]|uniref:GNAT family N-acetyltransferase n=1 Tax=unclassified Pseudomonas TaxID=196821 RepID=UPI002B234FDB|nr:MULTISPECIES: GNAT family N-acetyltransferase [unclassified Pseudomonas]MEA9977258.1 GNAT family N-acetyltransferase [Pseudomonas sp. RTS4]MEB0198249.1 GNAT family N-acetyltransferase [Pseudomonas sp. 5S4]MEB0247103.1 GNAT family N-acetyltransferase [Pseudomonas sp. 10S5]
MTETNPALSIRVADECFEDYILNSEFTFTVSGYALAQIGQRVERWEVEPVSPYLKNYGIDAQEFDCYRHGPENTVLVAWLGEQAVGHMVLSTHWNGFAHVDELAVDASARRTGVARSLLEVAQFWSRKRNLPGIMLETQNNNLAACKLYERCGYTVGGIDHLLYRAIDPDTRETAIFWYLIFE